MPNHLLICFVFGLGAAIWLPPFLQTWHIVGCALLISIAAQIFKFGYRKAWAMLASESAPNFLSLLILTQAVTFILIGASISCWQIDRSVSQQFPEQLELKSLEAHFVVNQLPEELGLSTRFRASIIDIRCPDALKASAADECSQIEDWKEDVRLSWYSPPTLRVGQKWSATIRLRRPRGLANFSGFDYQAWLLQQGLSATGYIKRKAAYENVSEAETLSIESIREATSNRFNSVQDTLQNSGLLRALAYGDKSRITQQQWALLNQTGTVHLMAISGLHIGLAGLLGWLLGCGLQRAVVLALNRSSIFALSLPALFSVSFAAAYALLAGFGIPTQRAFIMVVAVQLAIFLGRRVQPFRVLFIAAALVLLIDPFAFLATGFWLSFGAVAVLFFCHTAKTNPEITTSSTPKHTCHKFIAQGAQWGASLIKMQSVLFLGLLVPLILLGQGVSYVSPIANLVAVPVVSFLVVPLIMMALVLTPFTTLYIKVLTYADWVMNGLVQYLGHLATAEQSFFPSATNMSFVSLCIGALGIFLLLSNKLLGLRLLGFCFCLSAVFQPRDADNKNTLTLTVIDVGQGLAVLLESEGSAILYDTGAAYSENFDMGSRVILPILANKNIPELDALFVSHSDNDHAGGAGPLLNQIAVNRLAFSHLEIEKTSSRVGEASQKAKLQGTCSAGKEWQWGDLSATALWPPKDPENRPSYVSDNPNNNSCVLLLRYEGFLILLPGDIDKTVERHLVEQGLLPSFIDVIVAAHHGSKTSSGDVLFEHTTFGWSVFSAGYKNRYFHPHSTVQSRFIQNGSKTLTTALDGAIEFTVFRQSLLGKTERTDTEAQPNNQVSIRGARATKAKRWYP